MISYKTIFLITIFITIITSSICLARGESQETSITSIAVGLQDTKISQNYSSVITGIKQKLTSKGALKTDAGIFLNRLFNHRGMFFFSFGIVLLFLMRKMPLFKKWFEFLNTLQHELVHIVVAGCFGGAPIGIEVNERGGKAYTTKSNFIVRLAPYFLPFFCLLILGIAILLGDAYKSAAFILAGLFYGDFITKTFSSLYIQPDIQKSGGRLIAYPLIFVSNLLVLVAIGCMARVL